MQNHRFSDIRPSAFARRAAALAILSCAASAGLYAEAPASSVANPAAVQIVPTLNAATITPFNLADSVSDLNYSSSTGEAEETTAENFIASASDLIQPPPRRRYGRPRYSDSSHNPDGSNKYTAEAGFGLTIPTGITHKYNTPSYAYQVGFGRQFNKNVALLAQFDYDHFGLQGTTLNNESELYFGATGQGLDGTMHDWSFSVNPMYTLSTTGAVGAYVIGGVGFYHKVTTFTVPGTGCLDVYCEFTYEANENFDHYTSNSVGVNAGLGFTYKPSQFANERFFAEARFVFTPNSLRQGYTLANENTTTYNGYNAYPANSYKTTYIPVKFGIRF